MINLVFEKGERVTTGGKGRGEIGGEFGEVTGVAADAPTMDGLEKGMERLVDGDGSWKSGGIAGG